MVKLNLIKAMTKIGFARVSTKDQNLELQLDALKKEECEKIFCAKISGAKAENEERDKCIEYLRPGDTLVVWKISRLHRSIRKGINLFYEFKERGIHIKSIKEGIDTSEKTGEIIYMIFSVLADWDRENISENTKAGLEAVRARGRVGGRKRKLTQEQVKKIVKMHSDENITLKDILKIFGVSHTTMYSYLNKEKENDVKNKIKR